MNKIISRMSMSNKKKTIGYTVDHVLALVPMLALFAVLFTPNILISGALSVLVASFLEILYSILIKKQFAPTVMAMALAAALPLPSETPLFLYAISGAAVFVLFELRGYLGKYITYEPVLFTLALIFIFMEVKTPMDYVSMGEVQAGIKVKDLLLGGKYTGTVCTSAAALLAGYIYLCIRKRVNILNSLLFYAAFIAVMGFLYVDNPDQNAIYFISFVALDGRAVFAAFFLLNYGGVLPHDKKAGYAVAILCGAVIGYIAVSMKEPSLMFIVLSAASLLSRPLDVLICRMKFGKKKTELKSKG